MAHPCSLKQFRHLDGKPRQNLRVFKAVSFLEDYFRGVRPADRYGAGLRVHDPYAEGSGGEIIADLVAHFSRSVRRRENFDGYVRGAAYPVAGFVFPGAPLEQNGCIRLPNRRRIIADDKADLGKNFPLPECLHPVIEAPYQSVLAMSMRAAWSRLLHEHLAPDEFVSISVLRFVRLRIFFQRHRAGALVVPDRAQAGRGGCVFHETSQVKKLRRRNFRIKKVKHSLLFHPAPPFFRRCAVRGCPFWPGPSRLLPVCKGQESEGYIFLSQYGTLTLCPGVSCLVSGQQKRRGAK